MDFEPLTFAGGLALGLASSLHCAGMCGAIASGLMFAFAPNDAMASRARALAAIQAGRISAYVAAGAALGLAGSSLYGLLDRDSASRALRIVASLSLGWIGLATLGLAPSMAMFDRLLAPLARWLERLRGPGLTAPFLGGLGWGLAPCAMVYGALFYAAMTGSAAGGALVMVGFGLGTAPATAAAALGLTSLRRSANAPAMRLFAGGAILAVAAASFFVSPAVLRAICGL